MNHLFIRHRVNSLSELSSLEKDWGVEVDLRSCVQSKGALHLSHDPWVMGDDFESWLAEFKRLSIRGPIWVNTKEDGLEERIDDLMLKYQIDTYVFLDTVLPTLVRKVHFQNLKHFAVRLSAYEPEEFVTLFSGKAEWVWVDCFQGIPLSVKLVKQLRKYFKVCLVSPELHGRSLQDNLSDFAPLFEISDAVCTKEPLAWKNL